MQNNSNKSQIIWMGLSKWLKAAKNDNDNVDIVYWTHDTIVP